MAISDQHARTPGDQHSGDQLSGDQLADGDASDGVVAVGQSSSAATSDSEGVAAVDLPALERQVAALTREIDELDDRLRRVVERNQHVVRGWRLTMAVTLFGLLGIVYSLSLSERAPAVLEQLVSSFEFLSFLPWKLEYVLHAGGWGLAMIVAGSVVRSLPLLVLVAVGLVFGGVFIESLQESVTLNRSSSLDDIVANAVGVCLGLAVLLTFRLGVYLSHPSRLKILGDVK